MDDDGMFDAWFGSWKQARPEMTPIGWYTSEDLHEAFGAGVAAAVALTAAVLDVRPGSPRTSPAAGPDPEKD